MKDDIAMADPEGCIISMRQNTTAMPAVRFRGVISVSGSALTLAPNTAFDRVSEREPGQGLL